MGTARLPQVRPHFTQPGSPGTHCHLHGEHPVAVVTKLSGLKHLADALMVWGQKSIVQMGQQGRPPRPSS
jgi:hypothetical protein